MKHLGVALENIFKGSIVCIEDGRVSVATVGDGKTLKFPPNINDVTFMIQQGDLTPPAPAAQDDNKELTAPRFEVTIRRNSEADKAD